MSAKELAKVLDAALNEMGKEQPGSSRWLAAIEGIISALQKANKENRKLIAELKADVARLEAELDAREAHGGLRE